MRTNGIKARAEELSVGYQEARDEAFNEQFRHFIENFWYPTSTRIATEDDVKGFLESFTFPDENEWSMNAAFKELEGVDDDKHNEMKDEL